MKRHQGRPLIAYLRTIPTMHRDSGRDLKEQKALVTACCQQSKGRVLRTYCDVETGRRAYRPQLHKALAHAIRSKAILCIARLAGVTHDPDFLGALMQAGVDLVCCD